MYMIFDLETTITESHGRKGNPFNPANWVVARGWKKQGDKHASWSYHPEDKQRSTYLHIPDDVTLLVGFNIKFDLLWELCGGSPEELRSFFRRGGKIWDCQYVEYLLNGQTQEVQMCSLNDTAPKYGGTNKLDVVKQMWDEGINTPDIPEDILIDYLVGTEEEGRDAGDIGNTEKVFLGQIKEVLRQNQLKMVQDRMDGLLATTEMEFNGIKIDVAEAGARLKVLTERLAEAERELAGFIPADIPFVFNWNSPIHSSALIFGGTCKYKKQVRYKDEDGEWARKKDKATAYVLTDGSATLTPPNECGPRAGTYAVYGSGKKKGQYKTKQIDVPGEFKVRYEDFMYDLPGYVKPLAEWKTSRTDARDNPVYSSAGEVLEALGKMDVPFTKALSKKQDLDKEIGTYYVRIDKNGNKSGMLTFVQAWDKVLHHNLNHTSTVTTRLSGTKPNMQNIPRNDEDSSGEQKSRVKAMFVSRFGADGQMVEIDYSQLEVVVQGVLTGDENLRQYLREKRDFHCIRVAAKNKMTYEEALDWCKNENHPDYAQGKKERTKCKVFSFQRAYGAGRDKIALTTGMSTEEVQKLMDAEDELFPGVGMFVEDMTTAIKRSAEPFQAVGPDGNWKTYRRGRYQAPTGTIYSFRTYDAPDYLQKRGIKDSFMPTEIKNYAIQGFGGEIVQAMLGVLWRKFVSTGNYNGNAFLINTVHDCVWIDAHKGVLDQVIEDSVRILSSVPEFYSKRYGMLVDVPFPVEAEHGDNMNDLHHWHPKS